MMKKEITNKTFTRQSQSGFTLIELLVSATLGVFLVGGVITNFISTKSADKTRLAISEMDSNARAAMQILRQTISHAAYAPENIPFDSPFFSKRDGVQFNINCSGSIKLNTSAATPKAGQFSRDRGLKGDVITVVHLADNPCTDGSSSCTGNANINSEALVYTDCTGGGVRRDERAVACSVDNMPDPRDAKIYSTFYLKKESGENVLHCRGSRGGTQALVEGIHNMQFQYGVKQDDGSTRYFAAKGVETNDYWGLVVSVRVALLVQSLEKDIVNVTTKTKTKYDVLNERYTIDADELSRLYRVYTTTINLPNQDKGAL